MYRWHTTLSVPDTQWTEDTFTKLFDGKPFEEITVDDFENVAKGLRPGADVRVWAIDGFVLLLLLVWFGTMIVN